MPRFKHTENASDDLKNQLDMKRLRVHTSAAMNSRIFLQFLVLILISAIRKTAKIPIRSKI